MVIKEITTTIINKIKTMIQPRCGNRIWYCIIHFMKNGKRKTIKEIELSCKERQRLVEKEKKNCKYLRILEADTIKGNRDDEKSKKRVSQKN